MFARLVYSGVTEEEILKRLVKFIFKMKSEEMKMKCDNSIFDRRELSTIEKNLHSNVFTLVSYVSVSSRYFFNLGLKAHLISSALVIVALICAFEALN